MSEWIKVFPSQAGIRFVSVVDADSPTGFGLVEETASETKTALGLPNYYEYDAGIIFNGTNNPGLMNPIINTFPDNFALGVWVRSDVGIYINTPSGTHVLSNQTFFQGSGFPIMDNNYNFVAMGHLSLSAGQIILYTVSPGGGVVDVTSGTVGNRFSIKESY